MTDKEYKKRKRKRFLLRAAGIFVAVCIIVAVGLWNELSPIRRLLPAYGIEKDGNVRIHFLDVGQGDCEIVEYPDGSALLIDAGDGSWENDDHILRYLKGLGIGRLSVVVTHADSDHCGGIPAVLQDWRAEKVYLPVLPSSTGLYRSIGAAAERQGAAVSTLTRGGVIAGGDAYAVCISPYSVDETSTNDSSAVLFFAYAGVSVLFGGDITEEREQQLLDEQKLSEELGESVFDSDGYAVDLRETDVLKVSHHGSAGSSSAEWLKLLSPSTAVVSCGRGNAYGHPAGETLENLGAVGAEIYRTDELGDVIVTIFEDGTYRVTCNKF